MTWYAITTLPNRQKAVRRLLRKHGMTVYIPARTLRRRGKLDWAPLMRYTLIKAPALEVRTLWMHQVRSIRHVRRFVCNEAREPLPIPDERVAETIIRVTELRRKEITAYKHKRSPRKGDKARVKSGTLAGRTGTVVWSRGKKARLEAFIFGATRTVEIAVDQLEAA